MLVEVFIGAPVLTTMMSLR
jgi:hypothetical protein